MSPAKETTSKPFFKRRWVQVCIAIVILLPLLYIGGIFGAKAYLIDWLKKNGADSVTIEKLWLNPFTGKLDVKGLDVEAGGKTLIKHSDLSIDVGLSAIVKKDIEVQDAVYQDLVLDIEQYSDGRLRIGSYTLPAGGGGEVEPAKASEAVASAWAFLADYVHLVNCRVTLKTPELDLDLLVADAKLNKFTTREGKQGATLTLSGSLNGEPLSVDLENLVIAPALELGGSVEVSRFRFSEIAKYLKDTLPVFSGDLALSGDVRFQMGEGGNGEMQAAYNGTIDVKTPDIGSDTFSTKAANLNWQGAVQYVYGQDKKITIDTDGLLSAGGYELGVPGASLTTSESKIELKGKNSVTIADNVVVKNNGTLHIDNVDLSLPGNQIKEDRFGWNGEVVYDSDHSGSGQYVAADGMLELGPLDVATGTAESPVNALAASLGWKGKVVYGQQEDGVNSTLNLVGSLDGQKIKTELSGQSMVLEQGVVGLTTDTSLVFGERFDIKGTSSLALDEFAFQGGEAVPQVRLAKLSLDDLQGLGGKQLRLKELLSEGLVVNVSGSMPLDINVPEISLNGFSTDDFANYALSEITASTPRIVAVQNGREFLDLQDIKIGDLRLDESVNITAGDVNLDGLTLLGGTEDGKEKPFLTLGNAKLSDIKWGAESGFSGKTLQFDKLVTNVVRDKEGVLNIDRRLSAMQVGGSENEADKNAAKEVAETDQKSAENPATKTGEGAGSEIRLGEVTVKDNSKVHFEDHTLAVPYITDLTIDELVLKNLDSSTPEVKSPLVLKATLEDRAPITVNGSVSPFLKPVAVNMDLKLKNYPLSRLSAYTVQAVGTALASGQLNLTTKMDLANDRLDMKNNVALKQLETKTITKELAAELDNQLPIPLDTALSILRDSDGNIALDIPIKGPVSDLSVGISDVLITALSKAIVPAASGYLMYALGPYGALAYVGMKVGEKMMKLELPPVIFEPGKAEISEEQKKYLEKVAEIMKGRPTTDFTAVPVVASWEFMDSADVAAVEGKEIAVVEDDRQRLVDLGQQRAKALQEFLATTYGIDASRLLITDTKIETAKATKPSVLLQL